MKADEVLLVTGTVTDTYANDRFSVELESGTSVQAYLAGKLRRHNIRVVAGDIVEVELSPYDVTRGRITFRRR